MDVRCLGFLSDSIGGGEVLLLFAAVLVLFGPRRLPDIARTLGRALEQLRRASREFSDQVMRIDQETPPSPPTCPPPPAPPRANSGTDKPPEAPS